MEKVEWSEEKAQSLLGRWEESRGLNTVDELEKVAIE